MVRHVSRSRGCQTCRRRKIKCDEKVPECSQCQRNGRKCPGALVGTLFINMSQEGKLNEATTVCEPSSVASTRKNGHDGSLQPHNWPSNPIVFRKNPPEYLRSSIDIKGPAQQRDTDRLNVDRAVITPQPNGISNPTDFEPAAQLLLPASYQPSRISQFEELYINHFIDFYFDPHAKIKLNSWVNALPVLLNASPSPGIRYSIRAATMALYGKLTGDESIQLESIRWYTRGLESQRLQLQMLCEGGKAVSDASMVLVPLLFCHFESSMCTAPDAWMPHAVAAENILVMMGPHVCRTQQMHAIFLSVRVSAFYVSCIFDRLSALESEGWRTIPFEYKTPSLFDTLMNILFQIPRCLRLCSRMVDLSAYDLPASEKVKEALELKCLELIAMLDEYWETYRHELSPNYRYSWFSGPYDGSLPNPEPKECFRDTYSAYTIAHLDGAKLILSGMLTLISPNEQCYEAPMMTHSASILAAMRYQDGMGALTGGTVLMVFPLRVVVKTSPSKPQREEARAALLKWGAERGISGISSQFSENHAPSSRQMYPEQIIDIPISFSL